MAPSSAGFNDEISIFEKPEGALRGRSRKAIPPYAAPQSDVRRPVMRTLAIGARVVICGRIGSPAAARRPTSASGFSGIKADRT